MAPQRTKTDQSPFDSKFIGDTRDTLESLRKMADRVIFWEAFLRQSLHKGVVVQLALYAAVDDPQFDYVPLGDVEWLQQASPPERLAYIRGVSNAARYAVQVFAESLGMDLEDLLETARDADVQQARIRSLILEGRGL